MNRSTSVNVYTIEINENPALWGLVMKRNRMTNGYSVFLSKTLMLIDGLHNIYR